MQRFNYRDRSSTLQGAAKGLRTILMARFFRFAGGGRRLDEPSLGLINGAAGKRRSVQTKANSESRPIKPVSIPT